MCFCVSSWRTLVLSHYAVTADQNGAQSPEMEVYSVITLCYKNTRINTMMKFKTKTILKLVLLSQQVEDHSV